MAHHANRPIGVREAARIIYGTNEPSGPQVHRVIQRIRAGVLEGRRTGDRKHRWQTTTEAVARYMAGQAYHQKMTPTARGRPAHSASTPHDDPEWRKVHHQVVRDYFLALVFRRQSRRSGKWFNRAVVTGQATALVLLAAGFLLALRPLGAGEAPERAAVRQWLEANVGQAHVLEWFPPEPCPEGPGRRLRIRYRYPGPRQKPVETDRMFVVVDGHVVRVDSSW